MNEVRAEAVIYARDLARMVAFYERCLGFAVNERDETHAVLASAPWTLQLVAVPAELAAAITITAPPRRRDTVPVKLAFEVGSIDALVAPIAELGGSLDAIGTRRAFGGFLRQDAVDPEGNVIQLLEAERPVSGT